ncbi:MAG: S49 family peptidase [Minwuia sp.]|nr:S49 family peptidase [Minwuia sp.]
MSKKTGFLHRPLARFRKWRQTPTVSVLRLQGVISSGGGGPLRAASLNFASLESCIAQAFRPKRLAAVVLVVNSPGGSPVQSALIARAIRAQADEKKVPVLAFAEDVAASGGYWLMTAGDELYADRASILGSIGVISASFGFTGLIEKLGVDRRIHTAGENKSFLDPFSVERDEDITRLKEIQGQIHDTFMNQVKSRRGDKLNRRRYKEIFSGDVFLGEEAEKMGLIDGIADMPTLLKERFGKDVRMRQIGVRRSPLRGLLRGGSAAEATREVIAGIEDRLHWSRYGL